MVQIVTVSATTAGYVTEGLRPGARVNGATHSADAVHAQVQEARRVDSVQHAQLRDVVGPPSITAFFVTAGERGRLLAQTTLRQAENAYLGKDEVEEADARDDEQDQQSGEDGQEQPEKEQQLEPDILALPSPEQLLQSFES